MFLKRLLQLNIRYRFDPSLRNELDDGIQVRVAIDPPGSRIKFSRTRQKSKRLHRCLGTGQFAQWPFAPEVQVMQRPADRRRT